MRTTWSSLQRVVSFVGQVVRRIWVCCDIATVGMHVVVRFVDAVDVCVVGLATPHMRVSLSPMACGNSFVAREQEVGCASAVWLGYKCAIRSAIFAGSVHHVFVFRYAGCCDIVMCVI